MEHDEESVNSASPNDPQKTDSSTEQNEELPWLDAIASLEWRTAH